MRNALPSLCGLQWLLSCLEQGYTAGETAWHSLGRAASKRASISFSHCPALDNPAPVSTEHWDCIRCEPHIHPVTCLLCMVRLSLDMPFEGRPRAPRTALKLCIRGYQQRHSLSKHSQMQSASPRPRLSNRGPLGAARELGKHGRHRQS